MTSNRAAGFTLVELMIAVVVIGILAAISIPNYVSMRSRSYDASMKSDLHSTFLHIEDYKILNDSALPASSAALEAGTGFDLSPGVTWDRFSPQNRNGMPSVHIHLAHARSPNKWHAHYPAEGSEIEVRN